MDINIVITDTFGGMNGIRTYWREAGTQLFKRDT